MQHKFWDVKKKTAVTTEVLKKVTYNNKKTGRTTYAFKAETSDGRPLTAFVKKVDFDNAKL
ncbi:MAG: hypothetical protein WC269_02060 [Candidatus Gracilibacteria bacterium]|jgi:hypothetical protein